MRTLVVGAGALGGLFGGMLARSGEDVTFLARGATLERLRHDELSVESAKFGTFSLPVVVTDDPGPAGPFDLIFFSVKAYDLEDAARQVVPALGPGTTVMAVQNGIDHPQRLEAIFGRGTVVPGVVYVSTTVPAPGQIVHVGGPGLLQLGEIDGRFGDRVAAIAGRYAAARVPVETFADIRPQLWTKFAMICAMSGVSALSRLTLRQIFDEPVSRTFYRDVMAEVVDVALAAGAGISPDTADRLLEMQEAMPALPERGSMAYDLFAGRRLEIEMLNGTVARLGAELGVPVPFNSAITACLMPYRFGSSNGAV